MTIPSAGPRSRLAAFLAVVVLTASTPADVKAQLRATQPALAPPQQLLPPASANPASGSSLFRPDDRPVPPADIPSIPSTSPSTSLVAPGPVTAPTPIVPAPSAPAQSAPAQSAPMVPAGQAALVLSARFGRDNPQPINGGLQWRVYSVRPDGSGAFRPIREDRNPSPTFVLPSGEYVVHVTFGLASAVKTVQLRSETVRETFELPAGGLRIEGRVGDVRIPPGQISFDVFEGSQFEPGEKPPIAHGVMTGDILILPEGTYHIVSSYGDGNAVVRSDIRVQVGKLTDVTVNHRAAVITLKLVSESGGEALANTAWSVLTPGGDVIKESIGAFPKVILAEGEYRVIARNEGKVYERDFKVVPGVDGDIEVRAR
ncbi:MAG TPA: hypothetical protein VHA77_04330 [Xanthobacteraceae bacterium]|jgi:hypothetical protein|nr:hypothetical protein [Xanthobacteraceae bacterium]